MEEQIKDLQVRVEEAGAANLPKGERTLENFQQQIRELQLDLDKKRQRNSEVLKTVRNCKERVLELELKVAEDRKSHDALQGVIDTLQQTVKTFRKQCEEVDAIAAEHLSKYSRVQQQLEDAEQRAERAENVADKLREKNRNADSA
ncbi:hypothetical protein JTE90_020919 [Oedothorax gibbosus]|uniref:Uncharacterized protein n=1 Tax=Oedothorax gibbosus TaxID=931172 RepID=A0AAV6VNF8_9ARAC|nr:hypothetical protein JTE90_020919 [Oedothorax gibbosus]